MNWMTFSAIITKLALREHLHYHIPENKVIWDRHGKPRKLTSTSDKVSNKSPAQAHGNKAKKKRPR
jgi:hypothetical protein